MYFGDVMASNVLVYLASLYTSQNDVILLVGAYMCEEVIEGI